MTSRGGTAALRDSCGIKRLKAATRSSSTLAATAISIPLPDVDTIARLANHICPELRQDHMERRNGEAVPDRERVDGRRASPPGKEICVVWPLRQGPEID